LEPEAYATVAPVSVTSVTAILRSTTRSRHIQPSQTPPYAACAGAIVGAAGASLTCGSSAFTWLEDDPGRRPDWKLGQEYVVELPVVWHAARSNAATKPASPDFIPIISLSTSRGAHGIRVNPHAAPD
jgi:hypothetical protein